MLRKVAGAWIVLLLSLAYSTPLFGQKPDIVAGSLQYPRIIEPGKVRMSLEVSLAKAPEDILLEMSQFRAPLFSFDLYYGLPENFLLEGKWTTVIFFTNQIAVGAKWTHEWDKLHASIGDDVAYIVGHLDNGAVKTFDNSMKGWINYPNMSVGYAFNAFAITLRGELNILTSITATSDDIQISSDANIFNGGAVALYVEQPFWKDHFINIGAKANFIKFFYPTWPIFPTFNKTYFIPEFIVGFHL